MPRGPCPVPVTQHDTVPQYIINWLALGLILAMLPHVLHVPAWVSIVHLLLLTVRLLLPVYLPFFWQKNDLFIRWARFAITLLCVAGIAISYNTLLGRGAGVALLVVLSALKLLECNNRRDVYIVHCLCYLLTITYLFHSQTILAAIYMCLLIVLITTILIGYNDRRRGMPIRQRLRFATRLLIQASPVMLVLFLLFPRINGPLWGLPADAYSAVTGIDGKMSLGSVGRLIQSDAIVFRAHFQQPIPDLDSLYWRGPVFWHTDGRHWNTGYNERGTPAPITHQGEYIAYDVTMEPTNRDWLFALEMPAQVPSGSYITNDYQLKSSGNITARRHYSISSSTDFQMPAITAQEWQQALTLPAGQHLQARALAAQWRANQQTAEQTVSKGLDYFRQGDFVYTLTPALLVGDTVDSFLFETKRGFCEHYAISFAVLMRAAGIPARIVTGYQGGEINPAGGYLIVRQYHAHAWVEVWLDQQGWTRIDPTTVITRQAGTGWDDRAALATAIPLGLKDHLLLTQIWQHLRNNWDLINYRWNLWVLNYGPERQQAFFARLGVKQIDWWQLLFGMAMIVLLISIGWAWYLLRPRQEIKNPAKRLYKRFCHTLSRAHIVKKSHETPRDFAVRAATARADLKGQIQGITRLYMDIYYGSQRYKLSLLKQAIDRFRVSR